MGCNTLLRKERSRATRVGFDFAVIIDPELPPNGSFGILGRSGLASPLSEGLCKEQ